MSFTIRQFDDDQSIGSKLHTMRRAANWTLDEMEEMTKIQKKHLLSFEQDRFDQLPQSLYARNFLRIYVRALGGDETYFLERFDAARGTCDFTNTSRLPRKKVRPMEFLVASRFIKFAVLAVFSLAVITYLGIQLNKIIAPPELKVFAPADGVQIKEATLSVIGETELNTIIKINGETVLLNQDGSFEKEIVLERGVNLITIEGAKRYSRSATEYRRVVF